MFVCARVTYDFHRCRRRTITDPMVSNNVLSCSRNDRKCSYVLYARRARRHLASSIWWTARCAHVHSHIRIPAIFIGNEYTSNWFLFFCFWYERYLVDRTISIRIRICIVWKRTSNSFWRRAHTRRRAFSVFFCRWFVKRTEKIASSHTTRRSIGRVMWDEKRGEEICAGQRRAQPSSVFGFCSAHSIIDPPLPLSLYHAHTLTLIALAFSHCGSDDAFAYNPSCDKYSNE